MVVPRGLTLCRYAIKSSLRPCHSPSAGLECWSGSHANASQYHEWPFRIIKAYLCLNNSFIEQLSRSAQQAASFFHGEFCFTRRYQKSEQSFSLPKTLFFLSFHQLKSRRQQLWLPLGIAASFGRHHLGFTLDWGSTTSGVGFIQGCLEFALGLPVSNKNSRLSREKM